MRLPLNVPGIILLSMCYVSSVHAQVAPYDSGGPLMSEQAAYDVSFYGLDIRVDPSDSTIAGHVDVEARVGSPIEWFVLDLVPDLDVQGVMMLSGETESAASFERRIGKLWIKLPRTYQPQETIAVRVTYGGRPRVALMAPWDGGFTWATTPSGQPWIATTCQGEGADIWWPGKDHVSDEPDSMSIRVTVPTPLVVASNGRLRGVEESSDGAWATYDWFVSTPINAYAVALNIAPYRLVKDDYESVTGDSFPVMFYVIPDDYDRGVEFFPEILRHLRFYEERLGPYPFRADKYGVAQTPHLGMEHQSIIAYGAGFKNTSMTPSQDFGFDKLHHHELAHEWWGNLVTNADWKDWWIHEGFGTYMQVLYAEELDGEAGYRRYLDAIRPMIANRRPVVPQESVSIDAMGDRDVYFKGAWVLHTLRSLVGKETLDAALRRMAYPDPALEAVTDGTQCRFASTDDFIQIVENLSGRNLSWFFDVYVRQARLPELVAERRGPDLSLQWKVPDGLPFPMPVEVMVDSNVRRIEMAGGSATLRVPPDAKVVVDPANRILMRNGRRR